MDEAKELVMRVLVAIYDKLYHLRCDDSGRIGNHNSKRQVCKAVYEVNKLLYESGVAGSIEQIRSDPHELPYGYAWEKKKDMIDEQQTVDVETIRHGRNLKSDYPSLFECSVCGWSDSDTYTGDTNKYNYCPNCGAKMDEVEE